MAAVICAGLLALPKPAADVFEFVAAITFISAIALSVGVVLSMHWAYTIRSLAKLSDQITKCLYALFIVFSVGLGSLALFGFALPGNERMLTWLALSAGLMAVLRLLLAEAIHRWRAEGRLVRRTVIVGGGAEAEEVIKQLEASHDDSTNILGIFDDRSEERSPDAVAGKAKLGDFEQLVDFCRNSHVDLLIVTVPLRAEDRLLQILSRLFELPVEVRIAGVGSKVRFAQDAYRMVGGVPMLPVMDRPLNDWDRVVKNLEDRILGGLLLAAALPVLAVCALLVRLSSKGPILFKQKRQGFNNELIEIYKFRSMYVESSDATASKLVTRDDPRVTPIGAFLRKSSLDELPQLINVVRGEMSIVGPRPHATQAKAGDDLYQEVVASYCARHRMKPGITGWAQVNGWRGETDTHEKIKRRVDHDLDYINRWSLWLDLYIIAKTPISLLSGKNAY